MKIEEFVAEIESNGFEVLEFKTADNEFYCEVLHQELKLKGLEGWLAISYYSSGEWYVSHDCKCARGNSFKESLQWVLDFYKDWTG